MHFEFKVFIFVCYSIVFYLIVVENKIKRE